MRATNPMINRTTFTDHAPAFSRTFGASAPCYGGTEDVRVLSASSALLMIPLQSSAQAGGDRG
jgi:hypothetical protein